jgi:zinc transport system substrate-binding protein
MNKRIFTLLLAALLLLTASGCSKKQALPEQKTADILATTQPVYQLASALTDGTGLSVSLLISEPVSCLHDYTLTVAQMEKIEGAQLVLESGLGLEDFMEDALSGKTRIDIASGLPTLTGDEGIDPHWWLDPTRFQQAAATAARELGAQYPEFSDRITENLAAFDEKLSDLQTYGDEALAGLSCRELVTFHDGFSYFADSFGLTIAAAMEVESGSEPSAKELEEIISIVEENQIPAVFTEVNGETGAAEVVAGEAGCAVRTLDMAISNRDYFAAMRQNIDIVKEALG